MNACREDSFVGAGRWPWPCPFPTVGSWAINHWHTRICTHRRNVHPSLAAHASIVRGDAAVLRERTSLWCVPHFSLSRRLQRSPAKLRDESLSV